MPEIDEGYFDALLGDATPADAAALAHYERVSQRLDAIFEQLDQMGDTVVSITTTVNEYLRRVQAVEDKMPTD